jgi:hypothetical protein
MILSHFQLSVILIPTVSGDQCANRIAIILPMKLCAMLRVACGMRVHVCIEYTL